MQQLDIKFRDRTSYESGCYPSKESFTLGFLWKPHRSERLGQIIRHVGRKERSIRTLVALAICSTESLVFGGDNPSGMGF